MKRSAVPLSDLKQLVKLVSGVKVNRMNIIGTKGSSKTKMQRFYDKLLDGQIETEAEAEELLYSPGRFRRQYYGDLKRGLFDRLLNTLFFIDVDKPQFAGYTKEYQTCQRDLLVVKLLLSYRMRHLAMIVAEKAFKRAVRFEFTEIALMLARQLRIHHGSITGELEKTELYDDCIEKYLKIYSFELKAEKYYSKLMSYYVFSSANKPEALVLAKEYCNDLQEGFDEVDSFRFRYTFYLVNILRFEVENNYRRVIKICTEALRYFETKSLILVKTVMFQFYFKMTTANLQLLKYQKAKECVLKSLSYVTEGEYNWYVAKEMEFLVTMRSRDYEDAFFVCLKVFNQPNFGMHYLSIYERWKINEAFIQFLMLKGRVVQAKGGVNKKFRVNRFLNQVPKHSKDKRGVNITILVLQILFLLEKKRYEEIFDRIEPLRMYSSRYLRKDDTFRGNCFIKMLMQLPAGHFHKEAVKRKAAPYLKKLESMPLDTANQAAELEIIPYEELWEYVMESLDNKVR